MEKFRKLLSDNYHRLALLLFLVLHSVITFSLDLYGDDYYYASFVRKGFDFFVSENKFHYLSTNGRAFVHLLDELLIGWGLLPWRIFNIICMAALVIFSALLSARAYRADFNRSDYRRAVVIICALYASADVMLLRQTTYWATGMMNYVFPALLSLMLYWFFRRDYELERGSWLLLIPVLFASITTEQAVVTAFLVVLCFIVSSVIFRKRLPKAYVVSLILSFAGMATVLFAPGTESRKALYPDFYGMGLFSRISQQFPLLFSLNFSRFGIYPLILSAAAVMTVVAYGCYSRGKRPVFAALTMAASALAFIAELWCLVKAPETFTSVIMQIIMLIPVGIALIYTAVRYFTCREIDELFMVWCAFSMQAAMLISPEFGSRTLYMSAVALTVALAGRLMRLSSAGLYMLLGAVVLVMLPDAFIGSGAVLALMPAAIVLTGLVALGLGRASSARLAGALVFGLCMARYTIITDAYVGNIPVLELNRKQLTEAAERGESESVILYYLPNEFYRYTLPYDNPYHQAKLLELYGLDPTLTVWYEFLPEQ